MGNRSGEVDVTHALAADLGDGDFDTAFFADNALVFHALVLAAQAFVILYRTKDTGAEQAVAFRLEGPVVDGFRLLDFTKGPAADPLRRGQADLDLVECFRFCDRICKICYLIHDLIPLGLSPQI